MLDFTKSINYINQLKLGYSYLKRDILITLALTGALFASSDSFNSKYAFIAVVVGCMVALYDLFNYRVLMVKFKLKYWGGVEFARFLLIMLVLVAAINHIGAFYAMLTAITYVVCKLLFEDYFLKVLNSLEMVYC